MSDYYIVGPFCPIARHKRCKKCVKARLEEKGVPKKPGQRRSDRKEFWRFCCYAAANAKVRAKKRQAGPAP